MKRIVIDGNRITNMSDVHDLFQSELDFPTHYGRNLDALYDCLTDVPGETQIDIENFEKLEYEIGKYAGRLMRIMRDAAQVNNNIKVHF